MNAKAWILFMLVLNAGCVLRNSVREVPYSSCTLSQQSAQKICMSAAQEDKLIPLQDQADEKPYMKRFRFNYSVKMPNGEIAAETFCDVDAAHNSVLYAQLLRLPATDRAIDYLHRQDLCSKWKSVSLN
jgi:hypothetical protein